MGYNTDFAGELKFKQELKASQIVKLKSILSEDCREHPEWREYMQEYVKHMNLTFINYEFTDNLDGIRWDESEKSYDMVEKANLIRSIMSADGDFPGFTGCMTAVGEEQGDVWMIVALDDGSVERQEMKDAPKFTRCPHCGEIIGEEK